MKRTYSVRLCKACGHRFVPNGSRDLWCPLCRDEMRRAAWTEDNRRTRERKALENKAQGITGRYRPKACGRCKKTFLPEGPAQKWCPDCAPIMLEERRKENDRKRAERYRQKRERDLAEIAKKREEMRESIRREAEEKTASGEKLLEAEELRREEAEAPCSPYREKKRTAICVVCGKEFVPRSSNQLTCSEVCRYERGRRYAAEMRARQRKENEELTRICPVCGKSFRWSESGKRMKYCSKACRRTDEKRREKERQNACREDPEAAKRNRENIIAFQQEAERQGMSYGQLMARRLLGG